IISKEPLGPAVRRGDEDWFGVVRWVLNALVEAEELGITQARVDSLKTSPDPAIQRFLGAGDDLGKPLGLDKDWAARVIKTTGNYGEIFTRNLGADSPLKLPRGLNALWNKGGLMYAPPLR
ncbi:MAG: amino acid ABC transporter substrate-binding protein, partial [Rhodocyclales bacterium]|nr:amino acid ABC transporter substrate-binding protein [Rhodocyclales bacterium]